jgi:hypothetical protein
MSNYIIRKMEIIRRLAVQAHRQPVLESGLWFHNDVRDNLYYASYLFAAASEPDMQLPFDKAEARATACRIFTELLQLQDRDPGSTTYGHWPLRLHPDPRKATINSLPVELMGSLMMYFVHNFEERLPEKLQEVMRTALLHIYRSGFFRKPLRNYNHHEAKYTAAKLLFGEWFHDEELLREGWHCLQRTLSHIETNGMSEYGCLPWFWHWVQAFTSAQQIIRRPGISADLSSILNFLWTERSYYYLKGTWVGPHSRGLSHDIPKDENVLFDYVQFGDFELPSDIQRVEYAGFLSYEAPEPARTAALNRSIPSEVKRIVTKQTDSGEIRLHTYVFITKSYAVGGARERFKEYDNEQHRWDVTFPLTSHTSVNQLFFFQPGEGYTDGDPRHQSVGAEVSFDRNVAMALYPITSDNDEQMIGILPKGEWRMEERSLFGFINNDVYAAVFMFKPYEAVEAADRITIHGKCGSNGVVVEVVSVEEARAAGIKSFKSFVLYMSANCPKFGDGVKGALVYTSLHGKQLSL